MNGEDIEATPRERDIDALLPLTHSNKSRRSANRDSNGYPDPNSPRNKKQPRVRREQVNYNARTYTTLSPDASPNLSLWHEYIVKGLRVFLDSLPSNNREDVRRAIEPLDRCRRARERDYVEVGLELM